MAGGERILIVEDDDLMRELMTKILAGEHYHIFQASSGEEALKLQEQTIDLVLTDLRLTGMNGLQLLTKVRSFDQEIVVIVMTAYASVETAVRPCARAYDYIDQTFINDEIRVMLRRALNNGICPRKPSPQT